MTIRSKSAQGEMGTQLSANYASITPTFKVDMWKVHSAVHRATNEKVSLWVLDTDKLQQTYPNKADRDAYFELSSISVQNMRKLRHPRILKILEVAEKKPEIAFAAEPIASSVASKVEAGYKMHPMDAAYISFQVAEVLGFLNQDARLLHLAITPAAVLLNDDLSVRLFNFQWATPLSPTNEANVSDRINVTRVLNDKRFHPPELLSHRNITGQADVFIFGLFMYNLFTGQSLNTDLTAEEILSALPTKTCSIYNVPGDFKQMIQNCLQIDPNARPGFLQLIQYPAFQSMQLKSLRYIDLLLTKDPQDKFKFYKGLSSKIDDFSPSLQTIKILPALMKECKNDIRFAPVLLGAILRIGENMNIDQFMEIIWQPLSFLITVTKPPEVSIALLRSLPIILEKVDKPKHKDFVYPIVVAALQSNDAKIHKECLAKVPLVAKLMNENDIRSTLVPRIVEVATGSTEMTVVSSAVTCIAQCLGKMDHDGFAVDVLPKLQQIWHRGRNVSIAESIINVIENMKAGCDVMMTRAIPLAAEIAGSHVVEGDLKNRLCDFMMNVISNFKSHQPSSSFGNARKTVDTDNPFGETQKPTPKPEAGNGMSASDIFGATPSAAAKPRQQQVSLSMTSDDIFGSSSAPAKPRPTNPPMTSDDIFGAPMTKAVTNPSPSPAPVSSMDMFGAQPNPYAAKQDPMDDIFMAKPKPTLTPKPDPMDDIFMSGSKPAAPMMRTTDILGASPAGNYGGSPGMSMGMGQQAPMGGYGGYQQPQQQTMGGMQWTQAPTTGFGNQGMGSGMSGNYGGSQPAQNTGNNFFNFF